MIRKALRKAADVALEETRHQAWHNPSGRVVAALFVLELVLG